MASWYGINDGSRCRAKIRSRKRHRCIEGLESRRMLAGDFQAGDANQDYYFDEADFVYAFQFGKFETDERAVWEEGDFNEDGFFNTSDLVMAFQEGLYRQGKYDDAGAEPINQLVRPSVCGIPNVTLAYESENGSLTVVSDRATTVHLTSRTASFAPLEGPGLFDFSDANGIFRLFPTGESEITFEQLLPIGLSWEALRADLHADGTLLAGGRFGNVQITVDGVAYAPLPRSETVSPGEAQQPITQHPGLRDGAPIAGDANEDYHFDSADFVLVGQAGLYESTLPATWREGDWDGDGVFDASDFVLAFREGTYGRGAYDVKATSALNDLGRLVESEHPDVTVDYDFNTGDIKVNSHCGHITSLSLSSNQGRFETMAVNGLFDISNNESLFALAPAGNQQLTFQQLLPPALNSAELISDLTVSGSMFGGGKLGDVVLRSNEAELRPFASLEDANSLLTYDRRTGSIEIIGLESALTTIDLRSASEIFIGTVDEDYTVGDFDLASQGQFFRFDPRGLARIQLDGIAQPELTEEQLREDLVATGTLLGGGFVAMALQVDESAPFQAGDANQDYFFDESDFVKAMKAGKYETGEAADGMEGDWSGDGIFNSVDLVVAFQHGLYKQGPYDASAQPTARNELGALTFAVTQIDSVEVQYNPATGDLTLAGNESRLTTFHLTSSRGRFQDASPEGLFDVALPDSLFVFDPSGVESQFFPSLLPKDLTVSDLLADLSVDGSLFEGGGLGDVSLTIVTSAEIRGQVFHDLNGDQQATPPELGLNEIVMRLEAVANDEVVAETTTFEFDLNGDGVINPVTEVGLFSLSAPAIGDYRIVAVPNEDWFLSGATVIVDAALGDQRGLQIGLSTDPSSLFIPGDTNQDFYFDEADLIQLMRGGGFSSDVDAWSDGDFNADGVFDNDDWLQVLANAESFQPSGNAYADGIKHSPHHQRIRPTTGEEESELRVMYMPATGAIAVFGSMPLTSIQIHSRSGVLQGVDTNGQFDVGSSNSFFRFAMDGFDSSVGVFFEAKTHLTRRFLLDDLSFDGSRLDGLPMSVPNLGLFTHTPVEFSCTEIRAFGMTPGDANFDGVFDSTDLTLVFQAAEYDDSIEDNSNWSEGDWNCDGDFDSKDIIIAFQADSFVFESRPHRIAAAVGAHHEFEGKKSKRPIVKETRLVEYIPGKPKVLENPKFESLF